MMKQTMDEHRKQLDGIFDAVTKERSVVKILNDNLAKMERDYLKYQRQYDRAVAKGLTKFERKD